MQIQIIGYIFFILIFIGCSTKHQKKSIEVKDSIGIQVQEVITEKMEIKPQRKFYKSNLDTRIRDTIRYAGYEFYLESIDDPTYNELFYKYYTRTKLFKAPYVDNKYSQWNKIETECIKKSGNSVVRKTDTLTIHLDNEFIELVNGDWESYWYVKFLETMNCHIVYRGGEGGGLLFYSTKNGLINLPAGQELYINTELNQILYCDFYGNVLGGGWTNYFILLEATSDNTIHKKFSIPVNTDYKALQNWGLINPVWISNHEFICTFKYGIIDESDNEADYQHNYVIVKYKKVSS